VLNLKRHKQFKKDLKRVNLTGKQFEKFIKYFPCYLEENLFRLRLKTIHLLGTGRTLESFI